ncbi:LOW QUALITY PROTEIN: protein NDRG2-like, partial [Chlamydotis macqueenii]
MGWEGVAVGRYGSGPAPQLLHPEAVEGLVLININPRAKGWVDWVARSAGVRGHRGGVGGHGPTAQPAKLTEAFKYFLQGMGYLAAAAMTRLSRSRTASLSSAASGDGGRGRSLSRGQPGGGRGAPRPLRDPPRDRGSIP